MKKFVAMMAMVIMMLMTVTAGMAAESTVIPEVHLNDLDKMSWNDGYDLHIEMYCSMPEYEYARVEMNISFNDNEWENYNHGVTKLYDGNTGEFIDEIEGNLTAEIDCSSKDIETVRGEMMEYLNHYDFEADAERGLKYYSIWF